MSNFKVGDVVFMKSNPYTKMTIETLGDSTAQCVWFDAPGNLRRETLVLECLTKYIFTKQEGSSTQTNEKMLLG